MLSKSKFLAVVFGISAFAVAGVAQDTKETPKDGDTKLERKARKFEGRGMHRGTFGRHGRMGGFGFHGVELTEAQKNQIKQIREANRPDPALREEMRTIMQAKRAGTASAEQETRLQALRAQRREKAESVHAQIQAVFTPEQKAQMEQRKQEMKARMQEMKQRMQDRRQLRQVEKSAKKPADVTKDN